jgi:hypothetical protein
MASPTLFQENVKVGFEHRCHRSLVIAEDPVTFSYKSARLRGALDPDLHWEIIEPKS